MLKKLALAACAVAMVIGTTGCAVQSSRALTHSSEPYNNEWSRAKNLTEVFGYIHEEDRDAPEGSVVSDDGSIVMDTAAWAGLLHNASTMGGPLPGVSGWGSVGVGLGLSILQSAFTPGRRDAKIGFFGYVPAEKAPDFTEARAVFLDQLFESTKATVKELYPEAAMSWNYSDRKGLQYWYQIWIQDEKLGCKAGKNAKDKSDWCMVGMIARRKHEVDGWLLPSNPMAGPVLDKAWVLQNYSGEMSFVGGEKQNMDWAKFMVALSKHLQPYTYIYVKAMKGPSGVNPPFVVEKDRVNFFIKTEAAKAAEATAKK